MAKKEVYKLNKFGNGLNNALHPSRIRDTELADALNVSLQTGSIGPPPFIQIDESNDVIANINISPGTGLFYFVHDYEMLDPDTGAYIESPIIVEGGVEYIVVARDGAYWIYDSHNGVWSIKLQGVADVSWAWDEDPENHEGYINEPEFMYIDNSLRICDGNFKRNKEDYRYRVKLFKRRGVICDLLNSPNARVEPLIDTDPDDPWDPDQPQPTGTYHFIANRNNQGQLIGYTTKFDYRDWYDDSNASLIPYYNFPGGTPQDAITSCTRFKNQHFDKPNEGWGMASSDIHVNQGFQRPENWVSYNWGGSSLADAGTCFLPWFLMRSNKEYSGRQVGYSCKYNNYFDQHQGYLNFMNWPIGGMGAWMLHLNNGYRAGIGMEGKWIDTDSDNVKRLNWDNYIYQFRTKNDNFYGATEDHSTSLFALPGVDQVNIGGGGQYDLSNSGHGWGQEIHDWISANGNVSTPHDQSLQPGFTQYIVKNSADLYRDEAQWSESTIMYNWLGSYIKGADTQGGSYWTGGTSLDEGTRLESTDQVNGCGVGIVADFPDILQGEFANPFQPCTNMHAGHWHEEYDASPFVPDQDRTYDFCTGSLGGGIESASSHNYTKFGESGQQNIALLSAFNTRTFGYDHASIYSGYDKSLQRKESLMYMDFTRGMGTDYEGPLPGDSANKAPIFAMDYRILPQMYAWGKWVRYNSHIGNQPDQIVPGPYQNHDTPDDMPGLSTWPSNFYSDGGNGAGYGGMNTGFKVVFHGFNHLLNDNQRHSELQPILTLTLDHGNHLIDPEQYAPTLTSVQCSTSNSEYLYHNTDFNQGNGSIYIDFGDEDSNPWGEDELPYTICCFSIHAIQSQMADFMWWKTRIQQTEISQSDDMDSAAGGPSSAHVIPAGGAGQVVGISKCEFYTPGDEDIYESAGWILDPSCNYDDQEVEEGGWQILSHGTPTHEWQHYGYGDALELEDEEGLFQLSTIGVAQGPDALSSAYIQANIMSDMVEDIPAVFRIEGFTRGETNTLLVTFVGAGSVPDYSFTYLTGANQTMWEHFTYVGTLNNPTNYSAIRIDSWDMGYTYWSPDNGEIDDCFQVAITNINMNGTSYVGNSTLQDNRFPIEQGAWKETDEPVPEPLVPGEWVDVGSSSNLAEFITGGYDSDTGYIEGTHMTEGRIFFDIGFDEATLLESGGWGLATFEGFETIEAMGNSGMDIDTTAHIVFGCSITDYTKVENEPVVMYETELHSTGALYNLNVKPFVTPCSLYHHDDLTNADDNESLLPDNVKRVSLYYKLPDQGDEWFKLVDVDLEEGIRNESKSRDWIPFAQVDNTGSVLSTSFSLAECGHTFRTPTAKSFQMSSGYNEGSNLNIRYKSSAVLGRHSYIADIAELDESQKIVKRYGSRILKSPSGRYDTFSNQNFIDIGINDGSRITALHAHRDKLMVFKDSVLYVVSTSSGIEKLMSTHHGYGLAFKSGLIDTPHGPCWVNTNGVFIFNEKEKITNITHMRIKDSDFPQDMGDEASDTGIGVRPVLSYNPSTDEMLIILDSRIRNGGVPGLQVHRSYLYNFKEDSLSRLNEDVNFKNVLGSQFSKTFHSNIAVDKNGVNHALVSMMDSDGVVQDTQLATWFDTPRYSTNHFAEPGFVTKVIDFKDRNLRKNVYKVYLSYKMPIDYATEGELRMYNRIDGRSHPEDWQDCYKADGSIWTPTLSNSGDTVVDSVYFTANKSPLRNIKSLQLRLRSHPESSALSISGMEINDLTIVFKTKPVK
tara:strand:- start:51940 stop:57180 length:5241 start_codon:yes stop_codon:yes gene_type:complete